MKKSLQLIFFLTIAIGVFANGLSLNSVGSKALGMGGAFVGLADDATAIYWNPAGMIGQKNSAMLFGTDVIPMTSYKLDMYGIDAETVTNHYASPNAFGVYNYKDFAFGFGAYVPAGLGAEWDGADLVAFDGPMYLDPGMTMLNPYAGKEFEWMSKIAAFNFSPAVAYKLTDNIYVGVAVNIYYSMMEMKRGEDMVNLMTGGTPGQDGMLDTQTAFDISGVGYGSVLSTKITNDMFDFGLTYKTPIMVDFDGTMTIEGMDDKDMEFHIEWPTWIGAGLAVKPYKGLKVEFDVQYTNWNEMKTLTADVVGFPAQQMHLFWNDATQIRLGAEYMINKEYAVRAGWYLDPAPCGDHTLNILFPSSTNQGFTSGMSYYNRDFAVDFGIEYLFGYQRDIAPSGENMPGTHQMDVFAFSLGGSYFIPVR